MKWGRVGGRSGSGGEAFMRGDTVGRWSMSVKRASGQPRLPSYFSAVTRTSPAEAPNVKFDVPSSGYILFVEVI